MVCRTKTPQKRGYERFLAACCERARACGLITEDASNTAAIDATGLETRHVSVYFQRHFCSAEATHAAWLKLTAVFHTASQLIVGAVVGRGPRNDSADFLPAMRQAVVPLRPYRVVADKAYDAEHHHVLCRQELGIRSTVIPIHPRRSHSPPQDATDR